MEEWMLEVEEQYSRDYKYYEKKHPNELKAMLVNLDIYFKTLQKNDDPLLVTGGFIHDEPLGMKAIDQKGKTTQKLKQTRLYIFADAQTKILHLLAIGDKTTQRDDIKKCKDIVGKIKL